MQYSEGSIFDDRYLLKKCMGRGSFGEVWLALDQNTEVEVAVKIYVAMDQRGLEEFKREFQVSFELNHTNLLRPNFLGVTQEDNCPYLVMTFCPNGSATKLSGIITDEQMWVFIRDVASGLAFLHRQNPPIVHQDIKPDNILISKNGDYVITDFGISHKIRENIRKATAHLNSAGSVAYMGPEHFSKDYISMKASDIWSLGVTIYELAYGDLPFCGMGGVMLNNGADYPELNDRFSQELNITMQACLSKEPWERPSAEVLAQYADLKVKGENPPLPWKSPVIPIVQEQKAEPKQSQQSINSYHIDDDMPAPQSGENFRPILTPHLKKVVVVVTAAIIILGGIIATIFIQNKKEEQQKIEKKRIENNEIVLAKIDKLFNNALEFVLNAINTEDVDSKSDNFKINACIHAIEECRKAETLFQKLTLPLTRRLKYDETQITQIIDDISNQLTTIRDRRERDISDYIAEVPDVDIDTDPDLKVIRGIVIQCEVAIKDLNAIKVSLNQYIEEKN